MTDTPETDAEANNGSLCDQCVPAEFARKLERERDKAIESRKSSAADWLDIVTNADKRIARAKRERDELRKALMLISSTMTQEVI